MFHKAKHEFKRSGLLYFPWKCLKYSIVYDYIEEWIKQLLSHLKLPDHCKKIKWIIIPLDVPYHVGGAEAIVKIVQTSLCNLPTSTLSFIEFDSVLKKISASINYRPLWLSITEHTVLTPIIFFLVGIIIPTLLKLQEMKSTTLYFLHMFAKL